MSDAADPEKLVLAYIDRLGVPYEVVSIDPEFADTARFCERYGYPPDHAGNTIVVVAKSTPRRYAACVVLATTRLDVNRVVKDLLGASRVSFASADEMQQVTGMAVGGVTAFPLPEGMPLFVDARVMALDYVILGTGGRSGKLKLSPEVLRRLPGIRVVPGLALERAG